MMIFDAFLFFVKYTPFWAVPVALMSSHFAYLYWLKAYKEIAYIWTGITLFCLTSTVIYLLLGGPDKITQILTHIIQ